jgi:hypothetical protein
LRTQACASPPLAERPVSIRERFYLRQAALAANKSKFMKGNERKKAFISFYLFFRNESFQRVTVDSNKKISFLSVGANRLTALPGM